MPDGLHVCAQLTDLLNLGCHNWEGSADQFAVFTASVSFVGGPLRPTSARNWGDLVGSFLYNMQPVRMPGVSTEKVCKGTVYWKAMPPRAKHISWRKDGICVRTRP